MPKLKPEIVAILAKKLRKKEPTIKKDIYLLRKNYPQSTINAVAQLYAQTHNESVFRKLSQEDKKTLPNIQLEKQKIVLRQRAPRQKLNHKKINELIKYNTQDFFRKGNVDEINRAYTYGCYTCVFVLLRKLIENMLIDILRHRFPDLSQTNKELYFDTTKKRFKDFGIIVDNFRKKSSEFGMDKKLVERIAQLSQQLKTEGNDKAHSWFHMVRREREIKELDPQLSIELISQLERKLGIKH
jgi:hypothetical protein